MPEGQPQERGNKVCGALVSRIRVKGAVGRWVVVNLTKMSSEDLQQMAPP